MSTDNLDSLSDAELSQAVAVECAGYTDDPTFPHLFWLDADGNAVSKTDDDDGAPVDFFATSADAVLPLIPMRMYPEIRGGASPNWLVKLYARNGNWYSAESDSLARAICISRLRVERAEKGAA